MTKKKENQIVRRVKDLLMAATGLRPYDEGFGDVEDDVVDNIAARVAEEFSVEEDEVRYLGDLPRIS